MKRRAMIMKMKRAAQLALLINMKHAVVVWGRGI